MSRVKNNKQGRETDSKEHEKLACQHFLELYNKQLGNNFIFKKFGNPDLGKGEPDCICSDGLNIEKGKMGSGFTTSHFIFLFLFYIL